MKKVYVVTDLGPGDGGKGAVVHKLCHMRSAHTVVKVGGAQGRHGVATSAGERYAFSLWGCGTFLGTKTHLSSRFVVTPEGLLNEADSLRYGQGIHDAWSLLTVDESALCATGYHGIASRLKELARRDHPRGTIGTGVGEAYRDAQRFPELAIHVRDLSRPDLRDRIAAVREQIRAELGPILEGEFLQADREAVEEARSLLADDGFLEYVVRRFGECAKLASVVDHDYLGREILYQDGVVVVECSHGVLTDCYHGFHPHTSAIRTLPRLTRAMLDDAGYDGPIVNIGVTRAYQIRHGAGPMPTDDPAMIETLLPGSQKENNRYQGNVRVGPLDLVLLRYAIACCGGPTAFDGLAVTWFDQMATNGVWKFCNQYRGADDGAYFTPTGELIVRHGEDAEQLTHQEALGQQLSGCTPEISSVEVNGDMQREQLFRLCANVLNENLHVPVRMVSFGPTEQDKLCR